MCLFVQDVYVHPCVLKERYSTIFGCQKKKMSALSKKELKTQTLQKCPHTSETLCVFDGSYHHYFFKTLYIYL